MPVLQSTHSSTLMNLTSNGVTFTAGTAAQFFWGAKKLLSFTRYLETFVIHCRSYWWEIVQSVIYSVQIILTRNSFIGYFWWMFSKFWSKSVLLQELPDIPLFLSLHNLCATLKCTSPSAVIFRSAVINAGYRISGTHVNPLGLKTDAPMNVIWDIMRCWVSFNHLLVFGSSCLIFFVLAYAFACFIFWK